MPRPLIVVGLALATRPLTAHVGSAIAFDRGGRLYFCDTSRDIVWRLGTDGTLSVAARGVHTNVLWIRDDGSIGYPDGGYLPDTSFVGPGPDGSAYRIDGHRVVRRAAGGIVEPVAGDTVGGFADGPRQVARFRRPTALTVDSVGNVYVADYGNRRVRRISPRVTCRR